MSEYVPTTEEIQRRASHMGIFGFEPMRERQFQAWLAAHDAEVAAMALEEFADQMTTGFNRETLNAERRAIKREARARAAEYLTGGTK